MTHAPNLPRDQPFRLGVLISGAGTTLQNLIDRIADGRLAGVRIAAVVTSRRQVEGVRRAERAGLPVAVVRRADFADVEAFSTAVIEALERHSVDLAVQAGWLCYWRLPPAWLGRVINVHPSLLPAHGGKGCYGERVHAAVLAAGDPVSGATVHFVNNEYDAGPVIMQRTCAVLPDDTAATLAARVVEIERTILPAVIELARDGRLPRFP